MSTPVDRLNLMRLFVHIAEVRLLSGAGRLLGLSQPSTSRQLKQLETTLGVELFQRSTHELVMTEAGKVFYEYADPKLESRSAGQKLLLRMGPGNEALLKAKLRELRKAVANRPDEPVTH